LSVIQIFKKCLNLVLNAFHVLSDKTITIDKGLIVC